MEYPLEDPEVCGLLCVHVFMFVVLLLLCVCVCVLACRIVVFDNRTGKPSVTHSLCTHSLAR